MHTLLLIGTELVAVSHLTMAIVLFIYARRSVAYLAQAWISLLTFAIYGCALVFIASGFGRVFVPLGMFDPTLLIGLLITSFLWSINPLGMVMPGYLQAGRMIKYAIPAAAIVVFYALGLMLGSHPVVIKDFDALRCNLLSGDVLLRLAALFLSIYYVLNIILLPNRLIRKNGFMLPNNVVSYASLLGIVQLGLVLVSVWFSYETVIVYEVLFTAVSLMLSGCIIKANISEQPYPEIRIVKIPPTTEEIKVEEEQDFNAANVRRFQSVEYVMQHDKPFVSPDFNRDALCRLSGFNRHILLQTLRSQGYNDVHDYISRYRVSELRRLIETHRVTDVRQHDCVGFRTLKTAVLAFERYEHEDLAAFVKKCANNEEGKAEQAENDESARSQCAEENADA